MGRDCIIAGGGPAGVCAALAAARLGAKVLLIEQQGCLGGALTSMGVMPMMSFHAGERQVIRGIPQEIVDRLVKEGASPGHQPDPIGYAASITPFDPEGLKRVLDVMMLEAGVQVLFHAPLAGVRVQQGRIESVTIAHKTGLAEYPAALFIDATGDGDLSAMAGVPFTLGRESDNQCLPLTKMVFISRVDTAALKAYIRGNPSEFQMHGAVVETALSRPRMAVSGFYSLVEKARKAGDFTLSRKCSLFFEMNEPGQMAVNMSQLFGVNALDPFELSRAEMEGRRQARELFLFLKKYAPGFANAEMAPGPDWIGVRETRHIRGKITVTEHDLVSGKVFEDSVVAAGYPIDIPHATGKETVEVPSLKKGGVYTVPYRALLPEGVDNLIVCGRCISATHMAAGALRVTPTAMATGQAAGTAAALSVKFKTEPARLEYRLLAEQLLKDKACLS